MPSAGSAAVPCSLTNMPDADYVFDAALHAAELARLQLIEGIFDRASESALTMAGLRLGARCLEIGAGAGSIAAFMAAAVGPTGTVSAVDINTRFLSPLLGDNVDVREADIRFVDLERAAFDIAHARFAFIHISEWRKALEAALGFLKPGGRLVLEEPDFSASRALSGPAELCSAFDRVHAAIHPMFKARACDSAFGSRLPAIFEECGLECVSFENDVPIVRGGSAMARMMALSTAQLWDKYLATGLVSGGDLERYAEFAAAPECWAIYYGTIRAVGTKAGSTAH